MKNTKEDSKNFSSIKILIILISIIVGVGILKFTFLDKKDKLKIQQRIEEKFKKEPDKKTTDINKGMNTTIYGEKYADSGQELEKILRSGKNKIDGRKIAYLTFDDGPSTTVTPKILKTLEEKNVKGTFFIVGNALMSSEKSKELLKEEILNGHAIANHSYTHDYKHLYPNRIVDVNAFMDEINKTNQAMKEVLGENFDCKVIRFPGGHMSWKGTKEVDEVLKNGRYSFVDWNALNGDAEGKKKNPEELLEYVKKNVNKRVRPDRLVVLMHDTYGKENTAIFLPNLIDYLKGLGYEFRTIKN